MSARTKDIVTLVVRLIVGGLFIYAGWVKIADMAMTVGFFAQMGLPAAVAYIVSYAELLGGIAVAIGFLTETAAAGLAIIMIGATWYSRAGGIQMMMPTIALFASALSLVASGAGAYAVGRLASLLKRQSVAEPVQQ